jgi:hypothetical protein
LVQGFAFASSSADFPIAAGVAFLLGPSSPRLTAWKICSSSKSAGLTRAASGCRQRQPGGSQVLNQQAER